jgi:beta-lactamase class A
MEARRQPLPTGRTRGTVSVERMPIRLRLMALALLLGFGPPAMDGLAHAVDRSHYYTVRPGETLGAISQSLGVSMARLAGLNNLANPDFIRAGQHLLLPDEAAAAPAAGSAARSAREYTVRSGDTLLRIATELGVSPAALIQANNLANPDRLAVGDKLAIPAGQAQTSSSTSRPAQSVASLVPELATTVLGAARAVSPDARLGVAARNLATGARLDIRSADVFHSASVNKIPIMVEAFRQIGNGKLARGAAVSSDLERMITLSDNEAANRLLDLVGEPNVNNTVASLGLGSTQLRNYFSFTRGPRDPGFNQSSPADMAALLALLANDRLVSSQEMRALLLRAQDSSKIARGLPAGTRLAHKSGWFTGVANDAGIIYAPRANYVLAVFSEGLPDGETGNQLIAAISRTIHDAWGK